LDTQDKKAARFVILIPHRDSLRPLEEYRRRLFSLGIHGAHAFPAAAPLASVSRPFSRQELKVLTRNIRDSLSGENFSSGHENARLKALGFVFFGPYLNLSIDENLFPQSALTKLLHVFSSPLLCAALVGDEKPVSEEAPAISFRAACLANLAMRPLSGGEAGYSFEWNIGPPVWLPKL